MKKTKERQRASTPKKQQQGSFVARLALRKAGKIARKHDNLAAAYFPVYSLVGAREAGFLLPWLNPVLVYCERKTSSATTSTPSSSG